MTYLDGIDIKHRHNNSHTDFKLFSCETSNLIASHTLDHLTCVPVCIFSITTPSWINTDREERDSCFLVKLLALKNQKQGKRPIQKCVTELHCRPTSFVVRGKKKGFWTTILHNGIMYTQQFPIYNILPRSWTQAQALPVPVPVTSS